MIKLYEFTKLTKYHVDKIDKIPNSTLTIIFKSLINTWF